MKEFEKGESVIIKNRMVGIVLSSYTMGKPPEMSRIYRVLVDSTDAIFRLIRNHVEQEEMQFLDDLHTLLFETERVDIIEIIDNELTPLEKP